jgi:hypothetical protein
MTSSLQNGEEEYYDFKIGQLNSYDAPIDTERDVTSYLGYFDTDFGPNYIRNLGANDYTSGGTSLMVLVTIFR